MDIKRRIVNIIIVLIINKQIINGQLSSTTQCELSLHETNYTLILLPSNNQQGHRVMRSRPKRELPVKEYSLSDIRQDLQSLESRLVKLETKLSREMRQLSKRVLRGARKMELIVDDLAEGQKSRSQLRSQCPEGFVSMDAGKSCYMFSRFNASWFEANDLCTALDSDLVALEEVNEHHQVNFLIRNNPDLQSAEGWWTSGSYINPSKQWVWKTNNDVRPFSYIKWAAHEPNEEHDRDLLGMMMLTVDRLKWHDQKYVNKFNFICEKHMD